MKCDTLNQFLGILINFHLIKLLKFIVIFRFNSQL